MKVHKIILTVLIILALTFPAGRWSAAQAKGANPPATEEETRLSTFGVGAGRVWPERVFAPFVDITAWVSDAAYTSGGALNLAKVNRDTGVLYYNLGFIAYDKNGDYKEGAYGKMLPWCFGGYPELSQGSPHSQYKGIKNSITGIREAGGDIAVSIGGGIEGSNFFQRMQDAEILKNTYLDIIYGFGLTRLDLDIEGGGLNKAQNVANAKAIKQAQEIAGIQVTLTLPASPSGLSKAGLGVLDAYLEQGVDIEILNLMTMCYDTGTLKKGESYGEGAIRAGEAAKAQLQTRYLAKTGMPLSDKQAYARIGTTISIGYQSARYPVFTAEWAGFMYDWAIAKDIGMLSFWSMNRDSKTQTNKGVISQYDFTRAYIDFTGNITESTAEGVKEERDAPAAEQATENKRPFSSDALLFGLFAFALIVAAKAFRLIKTLMSR